jgi:hypothetical protein
MCIRVRMKLRSEMQAKDIQGRVNRANECIRAIFIGLWISDTRARKQKMRTMPVKNVSYNTRDLCAFANIGREFVTSKVEMSILGANILVWLIQSISARWFIRGDQTHEIEFR